MIWSHHNPRVVGAPTAVYVDERGDADEDYDAKDDAEGDGEGVVVVAVHFGGKVKMAGSLVGVLCGWKMGV